MSRPPESGPAPLSSCYVEWFTSDDLTTLEKTVLAFETAKEDGFARDVTARYAREYGAKVSKLQQGGKGKKDWWERVMAMVRRPYRLVRHCNLSLLGKPNNQSALTEPRRCRGRRATREPDDGTNAYHDDRLQKPSLVSVNAIATASLH